MNFKKIGVIALMDALLLTELTLSVYLGSRHMETITWTFLKAFVPLAGTTVLVFRIVLRKYFTEIPVAMGVENGAEK
ncbi:MAG: hypothetical protein AB1896_04045 [Thermodesulfobacteriota bacterium]